MILWPEKKAITNDKMIAFCLCLMLLRLTSIKVENKQVLCDRVISASARFSDFLGYGGNMIEENRDYAYNHKHQYGLIRRMHL